MAHLTTKRVLFVDQYGELGGGQKVLLSLIRGALQAGSIVSVMAPSGGTLESTISREFKGDVAYIACEEPKLSHGRKGIADILRLIVYGWRFRRHQGLMRQQDIIYVNGLRHLTHLLILTRRMNARLIHHVHLRHSGFEKLLLRWAANSKRTFALVVNSRFVQQDLGINSPRIRLIENALDRKFAELKFNDRFTTENCWNAAVLGTIRPEKGQDIAIAALRHRTDVILHIIGREGEGAEEWVSTLKDGATTNVNFVGPAADAIEALARHEIQFNLVPSRWAEPFGLVAIEGMACSCLTIVSGRGGLAEIAERTGALIAPDAESLRSLMNELMARAPDELAKLARAQFARTVAEYSPVRFEAEISALIQEAAAVS